LIIMIISTITIIIILSIFVFGSSLVKKFDKVDIGISIYDETQTGLDDIFDYMVTYQKFIRAKYLVASGMELDNALVEVEYEK